MTIRYALKALCLGVFFFVSFSVRGALHTHPLLINKPDSTGKRTEKTVTATAAEADTAFHPVRRVWGLAFGDFYYAPHTDAGNRGPETNYYGVPSNRNAFQFRRLYLGYDYDIDRKFSVEFLLASEPAANTAVATGTTVSSSDNLADNKMALYIKLANLRIKDLWKGTDLLIGEMFTPTTQLLTEQVWGYRSIERTISDLHKSSIYDVGVALRGYFDPETKVFGYNVMVGNNSQANLLSAANANTGFFKAFYGDVYAKLFQKHLVIDLYADYFQTASGTAALGQQSRNMFKGFAAYTSPKITFGVEALTNYIKNGLTTTEGTAKVPVSPTVNGITLFARGAIYKDKLGFFARYDSYNPDNDFNADYTYTINTNFTNYTPYQKEHFYTAGIDYQPARNIHFMPNFWLVDYTDQRTSTTSGYIPNDHTLVYRLTFFYTFGK
jgi:hypothetical protein